MIQIFHLLCTLFDCFHRYDDAIQFVDQAAGEAFDSEENSAS